MEREVPRPEVAAITTMKVRAALAGDEAARAWMVVRFSPLVFAEVRYHMSASLRGYYPAEDVVADVWQRALPRFNREFAREDRRNTPRIVRFLSGIVLRRIQEVLRKFARSRRHDGASYNPARAGGDTRNAGDRLVASDVGGLRALIASEEVQNVRALLDELDAHHREIIVWRTIAGKSAAEVAARLGISQNLVHTRLSRALQHLKERARGSVFDELHDD